MADIVKGKIGNALMSVAPDGIVATADAIYDETKGKSQEKINEDTKQSLAEQANNIGYYECGTAAATAAKEITGGSYKLPAAAPYGGTLKVKFTYKNSAANPTLSINRSPAKPLYYNGSIASSTNTWEDGDVLDLYYDGTNFNAKSFVEKFSTGEKVKNVGIDDEPTAGSDNLVKSGGVAIKTQIYDNIVDSYQSVNLFDKNKIISGGYVSRVDGTIEADTNYFTTDYIPIDSFGVYAALGAVGGTYKGYACYSDKNESGFTHGDSNHQARWKEGDNYVRFSGLLTNIDVFMVVKGNSSSYPSEYVPYSLLGKLKDNSVVPTNLSLNSVYLTSPFNYYNDVAELYVLPNALSNVNILNLRAVYANDVILRGYNGSTILWTYRGVKTYVNDTIYELKCTASGASTTVSVGDVVAYLVFKDVAHFMENTTGSTEDIVDYKRASMLFLQPNIETYLTSNAINLPNNSVTTSKLADGTVTTPKMADNSVTIDKITFKELQIISTNLLDTNDPQYIHEQGYYIDRDTGEEGYTSSLTTVSYGRTGFIPVSVEGLYCNAFISGGGYGGAVYDINKNYLRSTSGQYTYQDGDAYVRFTLAQTPRRPYTSDHLMVWEGTSSLNPTYDIYLAEEVITKDVLPKFDYEKLNDDVTSKMLGDGVEICIPDIVPCVLGDTVRIYYRSIIKTPNPYVWNIVAVSNSGKNYPRYYEYTPISVGNNSVTVYVKNSSQKIVAQKTFTIKCVNPISSPLTNKNILMLGASMTADGTMTYELKRRLTETSGDGTPLNPTGLGLSNISFVGRLTGRSYPSVHQEAQGGWSWADYTTIGRQAYRFYVSEVSELKLNDKYIDSNNNYVFTIKEINVTDGIGNIRCTFTGSGTLNSSGILTLQNGTGDLTITYSSCQLESGNPFWNVIENRLDFNTYVNDYCNGSLDYMISYVGYNDFTGNSNPDSIANIIGDYIRTFAHTFHQQLPDAKLIQCTLALGSVNGGMAASYGADSAWEYYNIALKVWAYFDALKNLEEELKAEAIELGEEQYFYVFDTFSGFDCENLYPIGNKTVANRSTETEVVQTNGVHSTTAGKLTIADSIYESLNYLIGLQIS